MEKITKVGVDRFICSLYEKMSKINKSERICIFEVYRLIECSEYCIYLSSKSQNEDLIKDKLELELKIKKL